MKRLILILAVFLLSVSTTFAGEQVDLTAPVSKPDLSYYEITSVLLDIENNYIIIKLSGTNEELLDHVYEGAEATTLFKSLNRADFRVNSFEKKLLNKLITDDVFDGTVTGTPD